MGLNLGNIDFSSILNLVPTICKNTVSTAGTATSGAIINPNKSSGQLTTEEQQIYEQGEAEIIKLTEDYKNRKNLQWIDMGTIGEIRNNYEIGHPDYKKVLKKRAEIRNDA